MTSVGNTAMHGAAGVSVDQTTVDADLAAYDALPPILREQLREFPFNMKAEQLAAALAHGWLLNDLYEKVIAARRAQALGFAVDHKGQEHYV